MYTDNIERIDYKGLRIEIIQDDDAQSPRDWDNLGTMTCFHRNYGLGDKHKMTPDELLELIKRKDVIALPLFLLDHSGLWISTSRYDCDPQGWDTSKVGYIWITYERIKQEMARPKRLKKGQINPDLQEIKYLTKRDIARATKRLLNEVETYNRYLTGDVYGYCITDPDNIITEESCWGFFGIEDCIEEGKSIADDMSKEKQKIQDEEFADELQENIRQAHFELCREMVMAA